MQLLLHLVSGGAFSSRLCKIPRIAVHGKNLDLSAFLVVAWCAYRNISTVKLSVVVRTIVAEATMYFLAMVAVQIYVQLSYVFTKV